MTAANLEKFLQDVQSAKTFLKLSFILEDAAKWCKSHRISKVEFALIEARVVERRIEESRGKYS